jgi:hypothetical protein
MKNLFKNLNIKFKNFSKETENYFTLQFFKLIVSGIFFILIIKLLSKLFF